ncbi:hypothetical protein BWQ96_03247 [Gracilariopsis chorda]|uniref:Uncharacterized protein n=1 Tax=Gracilariopsis chorda TaxID=448386 RepID=A0A2V3IXS0_9FLOR|nr:hypothetical protein BWQ96_03247 [Gracilariopsis chorda]|eukprot:PXF46909.1 hypothetical protein BWQ96_03247 [Gracilariopsis chorda]
MRLATICGIHSYRKVKLPAVFTVPTKFLSRPREITLNMLAHGTGLVVEYF